MAFLLSQIMLFQSRFYQDLNKFYDLKSQKGLTKEKKLVMYDKA